MKMDTARWLAAAALAWAVAASGLLLLAALSYQPSPPPGIQPPDPEGFSLGVLRSAALLLTAPAAGTMAVVVRRGARARVVRVLAAVGTLLILVFFGFGGGIFYLPSFGLLAASALATSSDSEQDRS